MSWTEILHAPIVLQAGQHLTGRRFWVADDFAWTSALAAIYVAGENVVIEDVELYGANSWNHRWDAYTEPAGGPPGIPSGLTGIRVQGAPNLRISRVHVEGFPRCGIEGFGLADGILEDITVTRCFQGISLAQYMPQPRLQIRRASIRDLWGPGPNKWPGVGGWPSKIRPGGFIGSDGIVAFKLSDAAITDCEVLGEIYGGFKILNPQRTQVLRYRGPVGFLQGTSDQSWTIDKEPCRDTLIQDCTFDKSLGAGELVEKGNGFQCTWNVRSAAFRNCQFLSAGHDGHGFEAAGDCQPTFTGCTFQGWNGMRGTQPAYALNLIDGAKTNLDFQPMNHFVDQQRIVFDAGAKP